MNTFIVAHTFDTFISANELSDSPSEVPNTTTFRYCGTAPSTHPLMKTNITAVAASLERYASTKHDVSVTGRKSTPSVMIFACSFKSSSDDVPRVFAAPSRRSVAAPASATPLADVDALEAVRPSAATRPSVASTTDASTMRAVLRRGCCGAVADADARRRAATRARSSARIARSRAGARARMRGLARALALADARAWTRGRARAGRMASSARDGDGDGDAKRSMRRAARDALRLMTTEAMRAADAAIAGRLREMKASANARRVGAYLASERLRECSMATYIDDAAVRGATDDVMVFVPIVDDAGSSSMRMLHVRDVEADATRGAYDLAEPRETYADGSRRLDAVRDIAKVGALDVVVVPGVAFGEDGRRLGRGGGYYDAFLTRYADEAARVGATPPLVVALAYGCQVYPPGAVPVDAHDKLVDIIVTETRTIACTDRGVAAAS